MKLSFKCSVLLLMTFSLQNVRNNLFIFKIELKSFVIDFYFFKAKALNENMLDFVNVYKESVDFFSLQYKALSTSSRNEMKMMEKIYNARVLSRIGFVAQEMKDLKHDLSNDINRREVEINNEDSECLLEARQNLNSSSDSASEVIKEVAVRVSGDIAILNEIAVYPIFYEIEMLRSIFEVEIFSIFASINSVTNMFQLLIILESEIRAFGSLFEYYVNNIYTEMVIYEMLTNDVSEEVFPMLDKALEEFKSSAISISHFVRSCN